MGNDPLVLKKIATHLRSLGQHPPTPEARAEIERYLGSKWQGLQAVAAEVLGAWGDRESARLLRELLLKSYEKRHWWGIRGVAVRELARCVTAEDADWIFDLFFGTRGLAARHEVLPLIEALPRRLVEERLRAALQSSAHGDRRAALVALRRMRSAVSRPLLERLAGDRDEEVRAIAHAWLRDWFGG